MTTADPFQLFARFVEARGWTQKAAAAELGVHQTMVSLVLRRRRRPGRDLAAAIEKATARWSGGQIRASHWSQAQVEKAA